MKKAYYFIYVTTNLVNGRKYIGQHCTYDLDDHYFGSNEELKEDMFKYKEKSFDRKIIEYTKDIYDLAARELYWIKAFNAVEDPLWYNKSYSCSPNVFFMRAHTDESKKRIKRAGGGNKKGFRRSSRESYPLMGHRKGVNLTEEHKIKIGVAHTGPGNGFYGKKHSEETKRKMSLTRTGVKQSIELISKRVAKNTGKKRTEEQKQRLRDGQRRYWEERKKSLNNILK